VNMRGDSPTLDSRAAEVCRGIEEGNPMVASSNDAPASLIRQKMTRNSQPLLGPKPWWTHKKILKISAGVYSMSSTIEMSLRPERVMIEDEDMAVMNGEHVAGGRRLNFAILSTSVRCLLIQ